MKKKVLSVLLCTAMVAAMLTGCGKDKETAATEGGKKGDSYKVYLITMDQMDQYWANVDKGCKKAVDELKSGGVTVDYKWSAPDKKDDAQQIEKINNAVADGAQAILLAANGPTAVNESLKEAEAAGVKIVYVDSPADYPAVRTLSTDNEAAGKTAGEKLIEALKAKNITSGDIGIISVNTSTDSTMKRENGFRSAFDGTEFKILETQYCEGEAAQSQNAASNFLAQGCVGLYGCNEGSTVGVGNAIKEAGGKAIGIGFDTSDAILDLIEQGNLLGAMAQNPSTMGYEGVKTAIKAIKGEEAGENLDTGVTAVTKDNVADYKK
ncbi:monosaccharide ABC transporter substrate-binding protein, CUT2 family (TC 3.A.1.2.-) [Anaerocolumna jejuensis DSM 15929]|uniref:Monosaccharide ABC transporter substrate-binding protein, CUT2 family (TC 3.A.1.2.-) n=1 Tax=Anaerocolumna jejuensis DSM 15929 TaxID=1121322 RepID=A0A1M6SYB5_9FIRM|nr:substrate-binding domain-containing protein [Anaerocolumna jejuensis]SHK49669.1 monosaccharide ABC transporter substrate-binding protein, CUT2 family (TC 3.A.1.2.-) [Anaerocolumna jejuensis DSM 15929]